MIFTHYKHISKKKFETLRNIQCQERIVAYNRAPHHNVKNLTPIFMWLIYLQYVQPKLFGNFDVKSNRKFQIRYAQS